MDVAPAIDPAWRSSACSSTTPRGSTSRAAGSPAPTRSTTHLVVDGRVATGTRVALRALHRRTPPGRGRLARRIPATRARRRAEGDRGEVQRALRRLRLRVLPRLTRQRRHAPRPRDALARRHRRRDPDLGCAATVPRAAAQHPRPLDRARPLPRRRRPDGVRRSLPGRLAARRPEDAPRGARPDLRAVALHDQARPARHPTRLLRAPRVLRGRRADEHHGSSSTRCARSPRGRRRSHTSSPSPTITARTRSRSRPTSATTTITCDAGKRSCANATRRPERLVAVAAGRRRRLLADRRRHARRSTARRSPSRPSAPCGTAPRPAAAPTARRSAEPDAVVRSRP